MMKNNFKIALFNERMLQGHGVDAVVDLIADGLVTAGYEVTVYTLFTDSSYDDRKYELKVLKPFEKTFLSRVVRKFFSDTAACDLELYLGKNKIQNIEADLFILNSYPFFATLLFTEKPSIVIDYGVASSRYLSFRHKINKMYLAASRNYLFFKKARKILTISNYIKNKLPSNLKRKARAVYLGADTYAEYPISSEEVVNFRSEIGLQRGDFLMLYVGRANMKTRTYKDLDELVEIYKEARSKDARIKLAVVGYGGEEDRRILQANGVVPLLNVPKEKMALLYSSCDLYVTATKWEGFDLPLAEAQFFGKPVVAYSIGAHPELCKNGESGFLVNSKEEFVEKVIKIANNPSLHKTLSTRAKIQSEKFTWERTVAECLAVVEEVLSG